MIKTWAFSLFQHNDVFGRDFAPLDPRQTEREHRATYDRYMELFVNCEAWGFEGVFFAEHHFSEATLSPSPHIAMAALAARTTSLRVGCLGNVLPLHDGRRFVEECGMLDLLSHGRLDIGIAPGLEGEAVRAGLAAGELRPRFYSTADLLAKAMADEVVTHEDDFYALRDVRIVPGVHRDEALPVWVSVMSAGSAQWAARRGWKMCTAYLPTAAAVAVADAYREAAAEAGTPGGPEMLGLRRRVFVAPTDAEAHERLESALDTQMVLKDRVSFEPADPAIAAMLSQPNDLIVGSPQTVAEQLIEQCREGGFGHLLAFTDFRLFDWDDLALSHRLIGAEVAPVLRSATVGGVVSPVA
jgi:alkanesulfonate monooxygenase SsuD/methylene tetrahydromethanopterin reductase-like flavin-dependent oxidoreductase (luciferase family)